MVTSRLKEIILVIIIGILAGLGTFRLASEGKLGLNLKQTSPLVSGNQSTSSNGGKVVYVDENDAIIAAVKKVSPSVVAVSGESQSSSSNFFDPFSMGQPQTSQTIGTGFVVSPGVIVTNKHVVADTSATYTVITKDGKNLSPVKIYRDPTLDLALIKINDTSLQPISLGNSDGLQVGQSVIAIGNALGKFDDTVTTGVVSGLGRDVAAGDPYSGSSEQLSDLIQTDAAINPGNSGGPLLNLQAQVIGVNVATTQGAQNIGFSIPINSVKDLVNQFVTTGTVQKPFLGIQYTFVSQDVAVANDMPSGAYIDDVVSGSPADKAGIQHGDVITKINNQKINSDQVIPQFMQNEKVGDNVSVEVWSNGNTKTLNLTLAAFPNQ